MTRWLKAKEVAARLGVTPRHFRERVRWRKGFPPAFQPPHARPLWAEHEIAEWERRHTRIAA